MPAGKRWFGALGGSTVLFFVLPLVLIASTSVGVAAGGEAAHLVGRDGHGEYCVTTTKPRPSTTTTGCDHTTTTVETTTTMVETTTTMVETTSTTIEETTTTEQTTTSESTTSTVPNEVLPTAVTTSTVPGEVNPTGASTSTVTTEVAETLPFTGSNIRGLLLVAAGAVALGGVLLVATRPDETD